jgi:hypothetical protein
VTQVNERRQVLQFDSSWTVIKWDEAPEFVGSFEGALHNLPGEGVKAADVAGVRTLSNQPRTLLVAEFKDFNRPGPDAAKRSVSDDLARNVVRKVIDTLCAVTFSHDSSQQRSSSALDEWTPSLGRTTTTLLVLICVEVPPSLAVAAGAWSKKLQQKLRWLGPNARVLVTNEFRPFEGDGITYEVTANAEP